jgi:cyclic pyranopterin phosphate synthase
MPEEGVTLSPKEHLLTADELLRVAKIFINEGVTKIRLTGGEPTLRRDLLAIVGIDYHLCTLSQHWALITETLGGLGELKDAGLKSIGMTTNGIAIRRHLAGLKSAGLDSLNISLDTLDTFQYELLARRKGLERCLLDCMCVSKGRVCFRVR